MYKYGAISALAAGLMSIFIVIRHTRADEEAGRLELVGSTAVGRGAPLAVGVLLAAAANCVLALLIAAGLAAIGLPAGGSAAIGLAVGTCGLVFAGVAAVTAQLSGERPRRPGNRDLRARRVLPGHVGRGGGRAPAAACAGCSGFPRSAGRPRSGPMPVTAGWCSRCRWPAPWS